MKKRVLLKKIRRMARPERGQTPELLTLGDEGLLDVFTQLSNGAGNRAVARMVRQKYRIRGSENSVQQAVGRLRKKIAPLIEKSDLSEKEEQEASAGRWELHDNSRLAMLRELERKYAARIQRVINGQDAIPVDIQKHVRSCALLSDVIHKMEKSESSVNSSPAAADSYWKKKSDFVLENYVGRDGDRMIRAAQKFLEMAEKKAIDCRVEKRTGAFIPVKSLAEAKRH